MAVNQLESEYQGQPAVFLEYDVDNADYATRAWRFWSAFQGSSATLPLIVVDSGNQIASGSADFRPVYRQMVDKALARPAEAEIEATWWREGDHIVVAVQLTNRLAADIGSNDQAQVHAIVYENAKVALTNHYVRATISESIDKLRSGATATYTLTSDSLVGVDWDKLAVVVIADHRPNPAASRVYDTLQAAPAARINSPFSLSSAELTFLVDPAGERPGALRRQTIQIAGAPGLTWTATVDVPWLTVTPSSGAVAATVQIGAEPDRLVDGWQEATVTFAAGGRFAQQVTVRAYRGPISSTYLPAVQK